MSPTHSKPNDESIRERAYHLWEQDGRPHGRDVEYWEQARALVETGAKPPKAAKPSNGHAIEKPVVTRAASAKPAPVKAKAPAEAPEASKRRTAVAKADPPKAKAAPTKGKPKK
jgi:hypothetical protein